MSKPTAPLPEWERVLSAAARLQRALPDAVLVGGTAAALHAEHRFSRDADHVLADLRARFDDVLAQLESVAGRKTARVQRPVQILGSPDGIETGVRRWPPDATRSRGFDVRRGVSREPTRGPTDASPRRYMPFSAPSKAIVAARFAASSVIASPQMPSRVSHE